MPEQQEQIPDEYLKAIGRVVVEWNQLESILDLCLIRLLGKELTDPRSHIVFTHMAYPQKMDALKALIGEVKIPDGSTLGRYGDEVQPLLKNASEARNKIMHSKWGVINGKVHRSMIRAKGALKMSLVSVSIDEIIEACNQIAAAGEALSAAIVGHLRVNPSPQQGQ
jgi:hypothetical protein